MDGEVHQLSDVVLVGRRRHEILVGNVADDQCPVDHRLATSKIERVETTTSCPARLRARTVCDPTCPAQPVTSTVPCDVTASKGIEFSCPLSAPITPEVPRSTIE